MFSVGNQRFVFKEDLHQCINPEIKLKYKFTLLIHFYNTIEWHEVVRSSLIHDPSFR